MMADMNDLVEFLLERLGEDEAAARAWPEDQQLWEERGPRHLSYASGSGEQVSAVSVGGNGPLGWERIYIKRDGVGLAAHVARHAPARVLAEVDAKRRIVQGIADADPYGAHITGVFTAWDALRLLALPYADHPDYQEEWRPR